jgi:hypothetical protein
LTQADISMKDLLAREKRATKHRDDIFCMLQEQKRRINDIISFIILHQEQMLQEQKEIDSEVKRISEIKKRATLISMNRASSPNARKDFIRLLNINEKIFLLMQIN